ncbi:MAG: hypothetical protein R3A79_31745 [Nannocystaceae bacterium]
MDVAADRRDALAVEELAQAIVAALALAARRPLVEYDEVRAPREAVADRRDEGVRRPPVGLALVARDPADAGDPQPVDVDAIAVEDVDPLLRAQAREALVAAEEVVVSSDAGDPADAAATERPPDRSDIPGRAHLASVGSGEEVAREDEPRAGERRDQLELAEGQELVRDRLADEAQRRVRVRPRGGQRPALEIAGHDQRVELRRQPLDRAAEEGERAPLRAAAGRRVEELEGVDRRVVEGRDAHPPSIRWRPKA